MSSGAQGGDRYGAAGGFGPAVVVLAALCVVWLATRGVYDLRTVGPKPAAVREAAPEIAATVWTGRDGGTWRARLSHLHPESERQDSDRRALATRLGLRAGAPFRLYLERDGTHDAFDLDLRDLAIVDANGIALRPLRAVLPATVDSAATASGAVPRDPLLALLAPDRLLIAGAGEGQIVLWGREPGPGARLHGLGVGTGTGSGTGTGLELAQTEVQSGGLSGPVVRVASARAVAGGVRH